MSTLTRALRSLLTNVGTWPVAFVLADHAAVRREPRLLEREDVVQRDDAALDAGDLADRRHLARPVGEARLLDDQVDRGGDLLADRARRSSMPAMRTSVSMREMQSRGEFEWIVVREPSWPVFMAWSMSTPRRNGTRRRRSDRAACAGSS